MVVVRQFVNAFVTSFVFVITLYLVVFDIADVRQPHQRVGLVVVEAGVALGARVRRHQFRHLVIGIAHVEFDVVETGRRTHYLVG